MDFLLPIWNPLIVHPMEQMLRFIAEPLQNWVAPGVAGGLAIIIFTILLPFLGVFIYLISQGSGMNERNLKQVQQQRAQFDDHVRSVAGGGAGAAAEIEKAKGLLDSGAITQAEFDSIKAKALA